MGFLKRIFGGGGDTATDKVESPAQQTETPAPDGSTGRFYMDIVGESNYQPAIKRALKDAVPTGDGRKAIRVHVRCETGNKFDPNAVQVVTLRGDTLGYLSRDRAKKFCGAIGEVGGSVSCRAVIGGGDGDPPIFGVWIDLCDPQRIPGVKKPDRSARGVEVIGEGKCQDALKQCRESGTPTADGLVIVDVLLQRESTNIVRISAALGETLGYLTTPTAKRYDAALERVGGSFVCKGTLHGGESGRPHIGIWLDLCAPEEIGRGE